MYFQYESGYDARELAAHFRQEKEVAKEMGLSERSKFLGLMQRLVCTFHGIDRVDAVPPMTAGMIRMKMANEANKILSYMNDLEGKNADEKEVVIHRKVRKVYKYPCPICQRDYNNLANHLKHAHKLNKNEIKELKKEKNKGRDQESQDGEKLTKRPARCCPLKGCTWVGRRLDYHLPNVHGIKNGSKKYLSLIKKRKLN